MITSRILSMHTADIETIVTELCAHEPAFVGREDEVRALVRALHEMRPNMAVDAQFVAELRRTVLAQAPAALAATPSPYVAGFDWTAWIARIAPISVVAVFFLILTADYQPSLDMTQSSRTQFVYPPAVVTSGSDSPSRVGGGAVDMFRTQPATTEPGYGGSADALLKGKAVQPLYTEVGLPPEMSGESAGMDAGIATSSEDPSVDALEPSVMQVAPGDAMPAARAFPTSEF